MKEIKAYKTTDGKIFENEKEAEKHQKNLDKKRRIEKWVEEYCYSGMNKSDIADALYEHGAKLV